MTAGATATTFDRAGVQRRALLVMMGSVIPTTAAMASSFAASAVLAEEITGSETLATLAAGSMSLGSMAAAVPLSRRMARLGRRRGLVAGWWLGAAGAMTALLAAVLSLYPLVVLGIIGVGAGQATNLAARYAVADLAPDDRRARAIGMLVWASTFGAAAGPTVALGPVADISQFIGLPELAGPYVLSTAMFLAGLSITHTGLRPDPLEVLGTIGLEAPRPASPAAVCRRIMAMPEARLALLAMLVGQLVMVAVMTATPLHMTSGDQDLAVIGQVISLHIIGMYAFSPIVGWLVDRVGTHTVITLGGLILFLGAELAGHTRPRAQRRAVQRSDADRDGLELRAHRGQRAAHQLVPGSPAGGGSGRGGLRHDHRGRGGRVVVRSAGRVARLPVTEPLLRHRRPGAGSRRRGRLVHGPPGPPPSRRLTIRSASQFSPAPTGTTAARSMA